MNGKNDSLESVRAERRARSSAPTAPESPLSEADSDWFRALVGPHGGAQGRGLEEAEGIADLVGLHRRMLAVQLGRDPGFKVAALDYLANIEGILPDARIITEAAAAALADAADRDPKTGCFNGRYFRDFLGKEIKRCSRGRESFSVLLIDIDDFKRINDTRGHGRGDQVIEAFARAISEGARDIDVVSRFGGDEFAVILPQAGRLGARACAERLRERLRGLPGAEASGGGEGQVSFSAGIATYPRDGETYEALLESADRALYRAKAQGKGRICDSPEAEYLSSAPAQERRRHVRVKVKAPPMDLSPLAALLDLRGRIVDRSEGGVLLECDAALAEPEARRRISLRLGGSGQDGLSGEVVRLQKEASRMRFFLGVKLD